jgi:light-regulated signal transduction histidine kinase (bacteriophytochrome)
MLVRGPGMAKEIELANGEMAALEHALSHDLEGSLRGITNLARILSQKHATGLSEEALELLQLIGNESNRAGRLLEGILDWAHCRTHPMSCSWQDATGIAQEAFSAVLTTFPSRQVAFNLQPLPPVWGDRAALRRIFRELFSNAIKFTAPQPSPTVSVSASTGNGEVVIDVRDNGVGFNMGYSGQLFGLFRRLHRRKEFEGVGAGLAIAREIVQIHGGRIWAEARPDQGATFHIALPQPVESQPGDGLNIALTV